VIAAAETFIAATCKTDKFPAQNTLPTRESEINEILKSGTDFYKQIVSMLKQGVEYNALALMDVTRDQWKKSGAVIWEAVGLPIS